MKKVTIKEWQHVPAGTMVYSGFGSEALIAPKEPGLYTLYELVYNNTNIHAGFKWEKEVEG